MNKQRNYTLAALVAALLMGASASGQVFAQAASITGNASIQVEGGVFSSAPSKGDMQRAISAARASLWKNYVARAFSEARARQMVGRERDIEQHLEEFISDFTIVDKDYDKATNTFRVAARGTINTSKVDQYFYTAAATGGAPAATHAATVAGSAAPTSFVFLMLARQAASSRQFDAKVTQVREEGASRSRADSQNDSSRNRRSGSADATTEESSETSVVKTTTGGSVETKSDEVVYRVSSSQDIDTAIGSTVTSGGFEVTSYDDVVANCGGVAPSKIRDEFVASDEMSPAVRKQVIDSVRQCEVRYFAIGTIDTGTSDVDPVSGQRRVAVSVRAQVLDLSRRLPSRVASVGPVMYAGLGKNQSEAMGSALQKAARESARTLLDQLISKGIR